MTIDKNIEKFIATHKDKISIYIETGFKDGDSLQRVLKYDFNKYFSIEFHQKYFDKQNIFLLNNSNKVIPETGDSGEVLDGLFDKFSIKMTYLHVFI